MGDITFLVGQNNSGKSTLVKAILLVHDYLKSGRIANFSFGDNSLENANIVTFKRALNSKAQEDIIIFHLTIEHFAISIELTGNENDTIARIRKLLIKDLKTGISVIITTETQEISLDFDQSILQQHILHNIPVKNPLEIELFKIKNEINNFVGSKSSKEYLKLIDFASSLKNRIDSVHKTEISEAPLEYTATSFLPTDFKTMDLFSIIDAFLVERVAALTQNLNANSSEEESTEVSASLQLISERFMQIRGVFKKFMDKLSEMELVYLGANSGKQAALFSIRDKNNALSQAIHQFYQLRVQPGTPAHQFVLKWMRDFDIGEDFSIIQHAGEAYEVRISSHETQVQLADKGMGSVQAMLLILRLACIIARPRETAMKTTVIIEEPELNLHPRLQSKLTDLFLEVQQSYAMNFIIETHSEYMLRRSQVIVAEREYETPPNTNPFHVYYFPKEIKDKTYDLEYDGDGRFKRNFGEGFFDEATNSTMSLLKIKRQK
jgi:predicted ATPase